MNLILQTPKFNKKHQDQPNKIEVDEVPKNEFVSPFIFVLGDSRTGTLSLTNYFLMHDIKAKHYFIDELKPDENFNASIFAKKSDGIIERILAENKNPIIVGGSGLYVKALIDGISESADTNDEIRNELLEIRKKYGNDFLYDE